MATNEPAEGASAEGLLTEIGTALFHIRRIWARPDVMREIRAQTAGRPGGKPLQLSNLMVVHAVAGLGKAQQGGEVTVGAVADRLEIDPSTASRLVGHAIDAGLVSRRPSPVDGRRADLRLTGLGRRVKQVADRSRRAYIAGLMAGWTEEERTRFAGLLTRFAEAATRSPMDLEGVSKIFEEAHADTPPPS